MKKELDHEMKTLREMNLEIGARVRDWANGRRLQGSAPHSCTSGWPASILNSEQPSSTMSPISFSLGSLPTVPAEPNQHTDPDDTLDEDYIQSVAASLSSWNALSPR